MFDDGVQAAAKLKDGIKDGLSSLASSLFKKDEKNENIGLPDIDADMPLSETPTEFPNTETPAESPAESAEPTAEDAEWTWEEVPAEETTAAETGNAAAESAEPAIAATENQNEDFNLDDLIAEYSGEQPKDFALTDEQENTAEEIPAAEMTAASDESEDGDWEWEYEEIPEDQTETPQESKETATEAAADSYVTENDEETANPLYSGDLIFHDNVYKNADDASPLPVVGLNLGIAEISDEKENKEPYIPKDDIVG